MMACDRPCEHLVDGRRSAGFNVSGFKGDSDLTGYEYVQRGFGLRLRFRFDETIFSGRDKAANPSLDR